MSPDKTKTLFSHLTRNCVNNWQNVLKLVRTESRTLSCNVISNAAVFSGPVAVQWCVKAEAERRYREKRRQAAQTGSALDECFKH